MTASIGLSAGTAAATAATVPTYDTLGITISPDPAVKSAPVNVSWAATNLIWDDGTPATVSKTWVVSVTGGGVDPGSDTCTTAEIDDTAAHSCTFTPTGTGTYTVSVAPKNDLNAGTTQTKTVEVQSAPTGTPTVTATQAPSSAVVNVTWSLPAADWGNAITTKTWNVSVAGGTMSSNGCALTGVADGTNSCSFTASTDGATYTVTATPVNEVGNGTPGTGPVTVTLPSAPPTPAAPTGSLTNFNATLDQATTTVNVDWTSAGVNWGTGSTHQYAVAVSPNTVTSDTCTTASRLDGANLTCSFKPLVSGVYTVSVTPKTQDGNGSASTRQVTYTAPPPPTVPAPNAPTGVHGTPGENSITVSWTAPVGGGPVDGYVAWAESTDLGDDFAEFCPEEPLVNATTCTISKLPAGLAYTLHVVAVGPDAFSDVATGTPTGRPTGRPETPAQVPAGLTPVAQVSTTPGATVTISGEGYKQGSIVVISVHSTPVDLGTAVVGADGRFSATVTLPANLPVGSHTLLATGLATDGTVKYLSKALTVAAAPAAAGGTGGGKALPVTGGNVTRLALGAFALLVLGVGAVALTDGRIVRRLRRRSEVTG